MTDDEVDSTGSGTAPSNGSDPKCDSDQCTNEQYSSDQCVPARIPNYSFEDLANGCTMIQIVFAGREYLLRRTRAGKLVLNK